ncbi:EF-hand domain-containing protein [Aureibaculum luteum]|uniref:hypothetical protein n=1 Tax=Aureibaculum luteum TaxID=1548456 RepID=UPI000E49B437|nr:hypothetical protein [Aureibaculum luteum]
MKVILTFFLFLECFLVQGQQKNMDTIVESILIKTTNLKADEFIGVDEFENLFYLKDNTFYKKNKKEELSYTNTQLGKITAVDIKNPLKILLFYKDFNIVVLLDNKLNDLSGQIDFNEVLFSKNISLVSSSSNNNFWIYSQDDNKLYVYNYKTNKLISSSAPVNFNEDNFTPNRMVASYKNCWLINENTVLEYDEYSNFKQRLVLDEMQFLNRFNNCYYWVKQGVLYYSNLKDGVFEILLKKSITIESFYVLNNEIYIFDGEKIFVFKTVKI